MIFKENQRKGLLVHYFSDIVIFCDDVDIFERKAPYRQKRQNESIPPEVLGSHRVQRPWAPWALF